jgi:hypothetical protein
MKKFITTIATALVLATSINVQAGFIDIELSSNTVASGDSINVSLWADSFSDFDAMYFDFEFDNSLFAYQAPSLQSELPAFDGFLGLEVIEQFYGLSLSFLDFDAFTDLNLDSDNKFLIASFDLLALSSGNSAFSITNQTAGLFNPNTFDVDPQPIDTSTPQSASATNVPEPSSFAIFMLSALMLVRRKKQ